ncbi:putative Ran GTPase binding protein [Tripterygium wilfordii]|uniref:Putative Ran GTPase binding protein n=1 Tax=Tripterygium wilfordii TaxID=458696 RepID=A0A7J7DNV7_TRIWF|nr:PH, RCC1 and FYVE domains-containing protein 1 [Tripterygium wilfordii]KAF5747997.1 putative Ran GTPase binding protein [Tripterygium wilfordii]
MAEQSLAIAPLDRNVQQAILAIKKGAHLLKCGRRRKPKFCPFRLSTDEKFLIWYSGKEEKQLRLSSVTEIVIGQKTENFRRQLQPDRENQSFSLIYANGERTLDLICKDKVEADSWLIGLGAVITWNHRSRPFHGLRTGRGVRSCVNSPAGYIRRKHNLGLLEDAAVYPEVHSVCGSPTLSLSDRCFSDGLSSSFDSFYSSESSIPQKENARDNLVPNSPRVELDGSKKWRLNYAGPEFQKNASRRFAAQTNGCPQLDKSNNLKDIMIWGEGVGANIGGVVHGYESQSGIQVNALVPKLLESTTMLDVQSISLGEQHAALVTTQGEVFCWGNGSGGRLGHKVNLDVSHPKIVESLDGVHVKSVVCSEYQTCALTKSGEVYAWGGNAYGADLTGQERIKSHWLPGKLSGPLEGVNISNVACGEWHTAMVSTSGQLFTYGDGTFGVLGHGNVECVSLPKEVESLRDLRVKSVACGPWHTAVIVEIMADRFKRSADVGKLFTWGDGDRGRLGHSDCGRKLLPTCVAQLVDCGFVQVSCGRMLTAALTNTGKVYTMGSAVHGQLGNPLAKDKSIAVVEGNLKHEFVKEISLGSYHVAVLTAGGRVYTWGKGSHGQLGLGDIGDRNSPTFVDALADRQVESIACGSNLTAAICLHKSVSVTNQSICSGCRMPFGLTRKKHNCYNCGLRFCHACSSRKIVNASLAPNKSKPSRVCDPCFNHLQSTKHTGTSGKLEENHGSRHLLATPRILTNDKDNNGDKTPPRGQVSSVARSFNTEAQAEWSTLKSQGVKQQPLESLSSSSEGIPRWGQVQCPVLFETYSSRCSIPQSSLPESNLPSACPAVSNAMNEQESISESNKMLGEEIQRLKAQARSLEIQCQIGNQKLQECQQTIEETWAVAREEAVKRKAANEVMKALVVRLRTMSEKVSSEREATNGFDSANLHPIKTVCTNSSTETQGHPLGAATPSPPPQVKLSEDRQLDSLSSSPIVFSNTLKSVYGRELFKENVKTVENSPAPRKESRQGAKASDPEWVEQYEPGVYITFTMLPSGRKELKRVRFSRKKFVQSAAERWWEENQAIVYRKYGIEGYSNSN